MTGWAPSSWWLSSMPSGTYTFTAANFSNWTNINDYRADDNSLTQTNVNNIIEGFYDIRASLGTPSINVGGSNAAPSATPHIDTYIPALEAAGATVTYTTP